MGPAVRARDESHLEAETRNRRVRYRGVGGEVEEAAEAEVAEQREQQQRYRCCCSHDGRDGICAVAAATGAFVR